MHLQSHFAVDEWRLLRSLSTPGKIQDFLNAVPFNAVDGNETCLSPRMVMRERRAQCMEGAMFAALALRVHGHRPLLLDLVAHESDADHVVAVFKIGNGWGAISKTNHAVLRYREPVYRDVRELAMSYFHEYFLQGTGKKTLRAFGGPLDLRRFDKRDWMTSEEPVWFVPEALVDVPHTSILTSAQVRRLRAAETIELAAGDIVEWSDGKRAW